MNPRQIIEYYSRDDVQKRMMEAAKGREVAGVFGSGAFGQRPNMLQYAADVAAMARNGSIEFHCSIERWSDPMVIKTDNYSQFRKGWDFVADVDCESFEHGKVASAVFCKALEEHGIRGYSIKFTGGTGFHIGVPWESMPDNVNGKPAKELFPDLPRAMCLYLKEYCRDSLENELMKLGSPEQLAEQANVKLGELLSKDGIDPFKLADLDSVLISPRHLFRMPYSINMKRMLASIPIKPSEILSFERHHAEPYKIKAHLGFLDSGRPDEAGALVAEASDWWGKNRKAASRIEKRKIEFSSAVSPENFPPCIKKIMEGMQDGKKRSVFILINFLSSVGWKWDAIENTLHEWNSKNIPPLPENYITTHMRWSENRMTSQGRSMMPPGCSNEGWYESIGVCSPDFTCGGAAKNVKNPVGYPARKIGKDNNGEEKPRRRHARKNISLPSNK
jgi:hypothetical protein